MGTADVLERLEYAAIHDMFEYTWLLFGTLTGKDCLLGITERRVTILSKREITHAFQVNAEDRVLSVALKVISLPPGLRKRWHTHVEAPLILLVL